MKKGRSSQRKRCSNRRMGVSVGNRGRVNDDILRKCAILSIT